MEMATACASLRRPSFRNERKSIPSRQEDLSGIAAVGHELVAIARFLLAASWAFFKGNLSVIGGVWKNVANRLPRPDGFAGLRSLTSFLKTPTNLAKTTAIPVNPFEHLIHNSFLFGNTLEPSLSWTLDVSISKRNARHDLQRAALGRVLLTSAAALRYFSRARTWNDPLHLKQQVIFRNLAERPV